VKGGQTPRHVMRFCPQDYHSSPLRGQLARERDHLTRMVYLELLTKLHEHGGTLARSEVDGAILITPEEADHAINRLLISGRIIEQNGVLSNPRVTLDLKRTQQFGKEQSIRGQLGGLTAGKGRPKGRKASVRRTPNDADRQTPDALRRTPMDAQANVRPAVAVAVAVANAIANTDNGGGSIVGIPQAFVSVFNAVFERRCSVTAGIDKKIRERVKTWKAWQIVAAPLLVWANSSDAKYRREIMPEWILRDGTHQKTGPDGHTYGGTDWLEREYNRADRTVLDERLAEIGREVGLLTRLEALGVKTQVESGL
jgi:hypothetical protein